MNQTSGKRGGRERGIEIEETAARERERERMQSIKKERRQL